MDINYNGPLYSLNPFFYVKQEKRFTGLGLLVSRFSIHNILRSSPTSCVIMFKCLRKKHVGAHELHYMGKSR